MHTSTTLLSQPYTRSLSVVEGCTTHKRCYSISLHYSNTHFITQSRHKRTPYTIHLLLLHYPIPLVTLHYTAPLVTHAVSHISPFVHTSLYTFCRFDAPTQEYSFRSFITLRSNHSLHLYPCLFQRSSNNTEAKKYARPAVNSSYVAQSSPWSAGYFHIPPLLHSQSARSTTLFQRTIQCTRPKAS